MKRMNYLINGIAALAFLFLFSQCAGKADNAAAPAASGNANATSGLKIAYVEVDTLLSQYNFCKDLNADMISKEENSRMVLNQKANELRKSQQEFQKKYESNAFISPERAQQEYARLGKLEQDLQALQNKLATEMASENAKNSQILRDSINAFLKEYNKTKGYNLIISNTSFDNLLYADSTLNITKEIVDGLNADILLWLRNKIGLLYYRIEEAIPITGLPLFLVKIISLFIVSARYFILLCRESE